MFEPTRREALLSMLGCFIPYLSASGKGERPSCPIYLRTLEDLEKAVNTTGIGVFMAERVVSIRVQDSTGYDRVFNLIPGDSISITTNKFSFKEV